MEPTYTIADLKPGDHLCCLYETEEEHWAVLTPFLRQGLERGEKVLYIVDAHTAEAVLGYLRGDGLDVEPYLESGQLSILSANDAYTREGIFDPDGMIALLRTETERALAEGYPALRITGEMTWALRGLPGSERLIEYEARLNEFFPGSKCLAICQYDRRRFEPALLLDVLATHPIAVVGTEFYENFYYMPPTEFLGRDLSAATLRHWLENLAERKRVEESLRRSEEAHRLLFEQSVDGIIIIAEGRIVRANPAFCTLYGLPVEKVVGVNPLDLLHPEDRKIGAQRIKVLRSGEPVSESYVYRGLREDGSIFWVEVRSRRIEWEGELALQSIVRDVTERVRAEEEIRRLNQFLDSVIDNANVWLDVLDEKANVVLWNKAAEEISGYSREEVVGHGKIWEWLYPDEEYRNRIVAEAVAIIEEGKEEQDAETSIRGKDGQTRVISWNSRSLVDEQGTPIGSIAIGRDVTERKRLEHEVEERRSYLESVLACAPETPNTMFWSGTRGRRGCMDTHQRRWSGETLTS